MRTNYYKDLLADYSKQGLISAELGQKLLRNAEKYIALCEDRLPEIGPAYTLAPARASRRLLPQM